MHLGIPDEVRVAIENHNKRRPISYEEDVTISILRKAYQEILDGNHYMFPNPAISPEEALTRLTKFFHSPDFYVFVNIEHAIFLEDAGIDDSGPAAAQNVLRYIV